MSVYFCFISKFSQLLFYLFLFGCLPLSILGFYISSSGLFFHILTGWLKNLNSVRSVIFLFSLAVWISLLRREGFLTNWWDCYVLFLFEFCPILDFFSVFCLCYCVAKGMYSSLIYCQKLYFSKADPFSYLLFKSPTLACFQYVGIPLYCCGHNFCLVSSKFLVPLYSFSVLHSLFFPIPKPDFLWKGTLLEFGWVFHDKQFGGCVILCTAKGMGHA